MKQACLLLFLLILISGCGAQYQSTKNVGDLEVTLRSSHYPLKVGDNTLSVTATDAVGKPVTDAQVRIKYTRLPSEGGVGQEFKTEARRKGKAYTFTADLPEQGAWQVNVMVVQRGRPALTAAFSMEAG